MKKFKVKNQSNNNSALDTRSQSKHDLIDIYDIYSKFDKEFTKIDNVREIHQKYPPNFNSIEDEESYKKQLNFLVKLKNENLISKPRKSLLVVKNRKFGENEKDPEIINSHPYKIKKIVNNNLEKHIMSFDFLEIKNYSYNASLILRNIRTKGYLLLGSNNYKYKIDNLNELDVVINVIGEYPKKTFEHEKNIHIEDFKERYCKDVNESILTLKNSHSVYFYTKPNENFTNYNYIADIIHKHIWMGERVLVHCQMGQIRSATLMLFYLRKYFFQDINEANTFIGLKRDSAGAPTMLISNIERIITEKSKNVN